MVKEVIILSKALKKSGIYFKYCEDILNSLWNEYKKKEKVIQSLVYFLQICFFNTHSIFFNVELFILCIF